MPIGRASNVVDEITKLVAQGSQHFVFIFYRFCAKG